MVNEELKAQKKVVYALIILVLASLVLLAKPANSQLPLQTIVINADGSVSPSTAPIQRNGNTYTFTGNLYAAIKIFRSNIMLDGDGHTLSGPYNGTASDIWVVGSGPDKSTLAQYVIGVDLSSSSVSGVTVENLNVLNFSIGMYIWTANDSVIGNVISNNIVGLLVSGSNMTITENYISSNIRGLFFGFTTGGIPDDIYIYSNDFEKNDIQMNGCTCKELNMSEPIHDWDFGKIGNYWSDYNGTDTIRSGIGDTPYIIDALNQDRYPLMQSPIKPSVPEAKVPIEAIALGVSTTGLVVLIGIAFVYRRKQKV